TGYGLGDHESDLPNLLQGILLRSDEFSRQDILAAKNAGKTSRNGSHGHDHSHRHDHPHPHDHVHEHSHDHAGDHEHGHHVHGKGKTKPSE
ncbi:MAG: hypothetical protein ACLFN0_08575, partial [Thermovirgaceae bacterium]